MAKECSEPLCTGHPLPFRQSVFALADILEKTTHPGKGLWQSTLYLNGVFPQVAVLMIARNRQSYPEQHDQR